MQRNTLVITKLFCGLLKRFLLEDVLILGRDVGKPTHGLDEGPSMLSHCTYRSSHFICSLDRMDENILV